MAAARRLMMGGALLIAAASPAQAGWFRDTVAATLTAKGGVTVSAPFGPPALVRRGPSFSGQVFDAEKGVGVDVAVDVGAYEIVVRFATNHPFGLSDSAGLVDITLSGLSPAGPILLVTFTCQSSSLGCYYPESPPGVTMADNLPASLTLGFAALEDGASYVYAIPIPATVPAPGALPLMVAGVLGLAVVTRGGTGRRACRSGLPRAAFRV